MIYAQNDLCFNNSILGFSLAFWIRLHGQYKKSWKQLTILGNACHNTAIGFCVINDINERSNIRIKLRNRTTIWEAKTILGEENSNNSTQQPWQWHHMAVSLNFSTEVLEFYLNGVKMTNTDGACKSRNKGKYIYDPTNVHDFMIGSLLDFL